MSMNPLLVDTTAERQIIFGPGRAKLLVVVNITANVANVFPDGSASEGRSEIRTSINTGTSRCAELDSFLISHLLISHLGRIGVEDGQTPEVRYWRKPT